MTELSPDDPRHGTTKGYAAGCREICCRVANARQQRLHKYARAMGRPARTPATGTVRRLQALMTLGWPCHAIAPHLGVSSGEAVHRLLSRKFVNQSVRERVAAAYEQLSMKPGPSQETRNRALRNGWVPPLAWNEGEIDNPKARPSGYVANARGVDEVLVQRALSGQKVRVNTAERRLVIERWKASGRSLGELDRIQGWNVFRDLREQKATA